MRKPRLSSLRLFMRVAHAGSFSEAARVMNTSQPALSRSIRLLEEELGVRLFDRDTRNMRLTASGATLLPIVERLTADFDQALSDVQETFSGKRGKVVIGALPSVAANFLPRMIADFQQSYPLVDVGIRDSLSGTLYQQMVERQVDFSITTPPEASSDFVYQHVVYDPCVLVCRAGDPLEGSDPVSWKVFDGRPFIAMAPRSSVRLLTDAGLAKADVVTKPLFECSQLTTVGALIGEGLGISALPRSTVQFLQQSNVSWRPLYSPVVERSIGIAYLKQRSLSPPAAMFLAHVRKNVALAESFMGDGQLQHHEV